MIQQLILFLFVFDLLLTHIENIIKRSLSVKVAKTNDFYK